MALVGGLGEEGGKIYKAVHNEGVAAALAIRGGDHNHSGSLVRILEALLARNALD